MSRASPAQTLELVYVDWMRRIALPMLTASHGEQWATRVSRAAIWVRREGGVSLLVNYADPPRTTPMTREDIEIVAAAPRTTGDFSNLGTMIDSFGQFHIRDVHGDAYTFWKDKIRGESAVFVNTKINANYNGVISVIISSRTPHYVLSADRQSQRWRLSGETLSCCPIPFQFTTAMTTGDLISIGSSPSSTLGIVNHPGGRADGIYMEDARDDIFINCDTEQISELERSEAFASADVEITSLTRER